MQLFGKKRDYSILERQNVCIAQHIAFFVWKYVMCNLFIRGAVLDNDARFSFYEKCMIMLIQSLTLYYYGGTILII